MGNNAYAYEHGNQFQTIGQDLTGLVTNNFPAKDFPHLKSYFSGDLKLHVKFLKPFGRKVTEGERRRKKLP
jgi:hypothetical protein